MIAHALVGPWILIPVLCVVDVPVVVELMLKKVVQNCDLGLAFRRTCLRGLVVLATLVSSFVVHADELGTWESVDAPLPETETPQEVDTSPVTAESFRDLDIDSEFVSEKPEKDPLEVEEEERDLFFSDEIKEDYLRESDIEYGPIGMDLYFYDSEMQIEKEFSDKDKKVENKIPKGLGTQSFSYFSRVMGQMTKRQRNSSSPFMKVYKNNRMPTDSEIWLKNAALEFDEESVGIAKDPSGQVNETMSSESMNALGEVIAEDFTLLKQFKSGLDFSFDFAQLFGGGAKTVSQKKRSAKNNSLRYGLVLQDVVPPRQTTAIAAMTSLDEEWKYASRGEPVWDVQPIEERQNRNPLRVAIDERRYKLDAIDDDFAPVDEEITFNAYNSFKHGVKPSAKFKGNVKPRDFRNANQLAEGALPPLALSLYQQNQLYSLSYLTKGNFEKDRVTHVFRAPVYEKFGFKNIFDEEFKPVETVAENILVTEDMPSLSLHYLNQKERYQTRFKLHRGHSVFSAVADMPTSSAPSSLGTDPSEKYKIDYKYSF